MKNKQVIKVAVKGCWVLIMLIVLIVSFFQDQLGRSFLLLINSVMLLIYWLFMRNWHIEPNENERL